MKETSARLLRLLALLQSAPDRSGADLAERLGVDARTVRRDVEKLRSLGYPVEATAGLAGYRLGSGAQLPPLLLDDDEAVAVAVGLRTAAGGTVAGIEESSLRALTKLERMLPSRLRHRVGTLHAVTVPLPAGATPVDPDVLTAVAAACRAHEQLRFDYVAADGASAVRRTEPHRLLHTGRRWYLVAWDLDRADWRTFRVDRLRPRIPTGPRFTPRSPPDVEVSAAGIAAGGYRYVARIVLHVPLAVAADRVAPSVGTLSAEGGDGDSCVLVAGSNSLDEIAVWVALFGFEFEVLEPPELVSRVAELAGLLSRAAGRS
ncbi:helix-turn-helix transcriptional regulator [Jiangella mangrovi]|uniref:Putative DNA-binding transcriptional regulator YafY n=1 Tax=Jiangella mangrovi TaxID=1524084 RepID=A0A7W9GUZ9_9ACTN|nr:YafY family protein [Jiangella mangrovi]MBB5790161.1 putative DNA-binding transcriptional regulator YafY [Jiangella mangrovi]